MSSFFVLGLMPWDRKGVNRKSNIYLRWVSFAFVLENHKKLMFNYFTTFGCLKVPQHPKWLLENEDAHANHSDPVVIWMLFQSTTQDLPLFPNFSPFLWLSLSPVILFLFALLPSHSHSPSCCLPLGRTSNLPGFDINLQISTESHAGKVNGACPAK